MTSPEGINKFSHALSTMSDAGDSLAGSSFGRVRRGGRLSGEGIKKGRKDDEKTTDPNQALEFLEKNATECQDITNAILHEFVHCFGGGGRRGRWRPL